MLLVGALVVVALSIGDREPTLRDASGSSSTDGGTISAPRGTELEPGDTSEGASVEGSSSTRPSEDGDAASGGSSNESSGTSSDQPGSDSPLEGPDLPVALPDLPDDIEDVLCSTEEREAIEATAAGLRESIVDEAEAAKDEILGGVGLGALLGGLSDAVQTQLDAVDAAAQMKLDDVDEKVEDAVDVCEAGGDPLSVL